MIVHVEKWLPWSRITVLASYFATAEVLEYCKVLDLDPMTEKDLLYIAKEGIKAPLPKEWKPV